MLSQGHMGAPSYHFTGHVGPRFGNLVLHVKWKWCHYIMVEADIHLKPLPTSTFDIYKVFELLVCCLKGIWVHPYTITPAKLAPDLGIVGRLWTCGVGMMSPSALKRQNTSSRHWRTISLMPTCEALRLSHMDDKQCFISQAKDAAGSSSTCRSIYSSHHLPRSNASSASTSLHHRGSHHYISFAMQREFATMCASWLWHTTMTSTSTASSPTESCVNARGWKSCHT